MCVGWVLVLVFRITAAMFQYPPLHICNWLYIWRNKELELELELEIKIHISSYIYTIQRYNLVPVTRIFFPG